MNEFYHGRSELTEEAIDELDRKAPSLIPDCVRNLNVWDEIARIRRPRRGW